MADPIVLYHGSRRWSGPPEVREAKLGRTEGGPGIYLTTSYGTARKYAGRSGMVMRVTLDPNVTWLEDEVVGLDEAIRFVRDQTRLPKKSEIISDLRRNAERTAQRLGAGAIDAVVLLNLMVNYDALAGRHGPALASFFVRRGIDVSHANSSSGEDWVLVFNTSKIMGVEAVRSKGFSGPFELPRVRRRT